MGIGAEISATLAGAGLTVGGLVAILLAAVAFGVIVSNWSTIEKNCHMWLVGDDTNEMRKANRLDWMIYPERKRDMKYYGSSSPLRLENVVIQ